MLMRMLVLAPYKALEKKTKKKGKEARCGFRRKGASDIVCEDTKTLSSHDEDEEEEESNSPLKGGRREGRLPWTWRQRRPRRENSPIRMILKRMSMPAPSGTPGRSPWPDRKYPKTPFIYPISCLVVLTCGIAHYNPAHDLPQRSSSSRNSLGPNAMESESPP